MSKNMFNGGNLRGRSSHHHRLSPLDGITDFLLSMWKHRCYACVVQRVHVSKHIDTACLYRYHHSVNQYRWYQIFGISIGPSLLLHDVIDLPSEEISVVRPERILCINWNTIHYTGSLWMRHEYELVDANRVCPGIQKVRVGLATRNLVAIRTHTNNNA